MPRRSHGPIGEDDRVGRDAGHGQRVALKRRARRIDHRQRGNHAFLGMRADRFLRGRVDRVLRESYPRRRQQGGRGCKHANDSSRIHISTPFVSSRGTRDNGVLARCKLGSPGRRRNCGRRQVLTFRDSQVGSSIAPKSPGLGMLRVAGILGAIEFFQTLGKRPGGGAGRQRTVARYFSRPRKRNPVHGSGAHPRPLRRADRVPHFGLLAGARNGVSTLGLIGHLAQSAADVETALHDIVGHFSVHDRTAQARLSIDGDEASLAYILDRPRDAGRRAFLRWRHRHGFQYREGSLRTRMVGQARHAAAPRARRPQALRRISSTTKNRLRVGDGVRHLRASLASPPASHRKSFAASHSCNGWCGAPRNAAVPTPKRSAGSFAFS